LQAFGESEIIVDRNENDQSIDTIKYSDIFDRKRVGYDDLDDVSDRRGDDHEKI
jgi:hypothetical protein